MLQVTTYFDFGRLTDMVKSLQYVSSESFLRSLDLKEEGRDALNFLRRIFPRSTNDKNVNAFGAHLVEGWKVIPFIGAGAGFQIIHALEKNKRVQKILNVIEDGHLPYQYKVRKWIRFFGRRYGAGGVLGEVGWVTLAPDRVKRIGGNDVPFPARTVYHAYREGTHALVNTHTYITEVLLPRVKAKIEAKVKARFARGYGR